MKFDEYKQLVKKRELQDALKKDITIESKELEEIIDITRLSSSAMNKQPLKYIIVTKKDLVKKLSNTCKWASHLSSWDQSEDEQPSAFIVVLNDTTIDGFAMLDCGITLNSIMIGLKIKGYASCPLASIDKDLCKNLFNLPQNLEPILGIAVGIEAENIQIVDLKDDTNYYRDQEDNHCVPKRALDEILVGKY